MGLAASGMEAGEEVAVEAAAAALAAGDIAGTAATCNIRRRVTKHVIGTSYILT